MLKLKKVAITGGLACGKSTVCRFMRDMGAYVVSADEIVHDLLTPHTVLGQKVILLLGQDIVSNGKIDRKIVALKVFKDKERLDSLEKLIHPIVLDEIEKRYQHIKDNPNIKLFVAEIPLLFEINAQDAFDVSIAVIAEENCCKKRWMQSRTDDPSEDEYTQRMQRQLDVKTKAARATYCIENLSDMQHLRIATEKLFCILQR